MAGRKYLIGIWFSIAIAGLSLAQSGGNFVIKDATLEGSGHTSAGGNFVSEIRLGQGLAGPSMSGGSFAVGGGIFPAPPQPEPLTPPAAPLSLSADASSAAIVSLSWTDASNNEEGFRVERCVVKGRRCLAAVVVGTTGPNVEKFDDPSVSRNTTYQYQVVAFNAAGETLSDIAIVKTPKR